MKTREEWLRRACARLSAEVFAPTGFALPPDVRVSCSWPGSGSPSKRIGECWSRAASEQGVNEVFISPKIDDPLRVLDILVHEGIHAIDDCKLQQIAERLGPYPHAALKPSAKPKADTCRQMKMSCKECAAVWRMTAKWIEAAIDHAGPYCPVCGSDNVEQEL